MATKRAANVQQEDHADQCDDDALLDQRAPQRFDGPLDQVGAVVDGDDAHVLGQARGHFLDFFLDVGDDGEGVLTEALQGDAADHLALAVELGEPPTLVRSQLDAGHVAQQDRGQALGLEDDLLEVGDPLQVAAAAHHVLGLGHLDDAPAEVAVVLADRVHDL